MTTISEKGSFSRSLPGDHKEVTVVDEPVHFTGYDATLYRAKGGLRHPLPPIVLCFCFLQFDRSNIGNALTDSLRKDINVANTQVNLAQTLFTVGFVITELLFNMISKYIGPERFLPITMFLWGTVTWSQVFTTNAAGLYACRFCLGALEVLYESGACISMLDFLGCEKLRWRALGGPLSIGLLSLRGQGGLERWQWLFLIGRSTPVSRSNTMTDESLEGVLTCSLGIVAYLYFPHNAARPKSLLGKFSSIFTPREASIIGKPVLPSHILDTFSDWRLYGHLLAALLSMVMISPMNTYAPSIIKSLGFTSLRICALFWSVGLAFSSDRFQELAAGYLWVAIGLLWLALAPANVAKWVLYGGVVWTQMGMGSAQAISAAWLTTKMEDYKRPVALAAFVMTIQLANFPGNQLFRTQDAPRCRYGLLVAASCAIAATVVILVWKLLYRLFDGGDPGVEAKRDFEYRRAEADV
ncbi:hypothetical protein LLEC1_01437 [Akanthomyces lecanii]|uniref:Major facilitator superfamily (MFS) profile domain-containing protein n=1 Tax=Cordyceps confragosa TaxID=2714763 RepID=A0A179I6Y1_CORDF|nr:hypothetical protein LLEC1_01437 [Akanthomyces lecanii]